MTCVSDSFMEERWAVLPSHPHRPQLAGEEPSRYQFPSSLRAFGLVKNPLLCVAWGGRNEHLGEASGMGGVEGHSCWEQICEPTCLASKMSSQGLQREPEGSQELTCGKSEDEGTMKSAVVGLPVLRSQRQVEILGISMLLAPYKGRAAGQHSPQVSTPSSSPSSPAEPGQWDWSRAEIWGFKAQRAPPLRQECAQTSFLRTDHWEWSRSLLQLPRRCLLR